MPTYEYRCDACGHQFDELQSFSEPPLSKCPECGKKRLRRLFGTGAAVLFKGSGFYETDYRSDSYKKAAKAEQEAGSKSSSDGANGKADTNGSAAGKADGAGKKGSSKTPKSKARSSDD
jgi:putative FmdB family regulatory protein